MELQIYPHESLKTAGIINLGGLGCIFGWSGMGLAACLSFAWPLLSAPCLSCSRARQELWHVDQRAEISPIAQG